MPPKAKTNAAAKSGEGAVTGGKTLSEIAYEKLKDKLISAQYVPGQFLQETQVSADLGLGRTPVNHALHRLQQEGLLEIIPRKGILVKSDSLSEIYLALEARTLMEPYLASLCAERIDENQMAEVDSINAAYEAARGTGDKTRLMELDRAFHFKIAEIAGNRLLSDFLRSIHERMSRIWFLPLWQFHDFNVTAREHDDVIAAIRARKPKEAATAMVAHLESLRQRIMASGQS
jgi:GntR family transcriptional regulator, rspAB operon transcriptional repressor